MVTATAYTILKLHATKLLKFKDMDTITDYLQVKKRAIVHALVPVFNCRSSLFLLAVQITQEFRIF